MNFKTEDVQHAIAATVRLCNRRKAVDLSNALTDLVEGEANHDILMALSLTLAAVLRAAPGATFVTQRMMAVVVAELAVLRVEYDAECDEEEAAP